MLKDLTIMIEDCEDIVESIKELEKFGCGIEYVRDFTDAMDILKTKDISLCVFTHKDMIYKLRTNYPKYTLPILHISSDIDEDFEFVSKYANEFVERKNIKKELIYRVKQTLFRCQNVKNFIEMSNKDFLTDLYNKKYFYNKASTLYHDRDKIALVMMDLNDFKMINDTFGHITGDMVIQSVAKTLQKNTKGKDIVARFGGDEFCILLQDIDESDAKTLMQTIQSEIASNKLKIGGQTVSCSISYGITTDKSYSLEDMMAVADKELLKTKKSKPKQKLCTQCCC